MSDFKTEQEKFWYGNFGDEYINRNMDATLLAANLALFSKVIAKTQNISSLIEFGSNIGMNLLALHQLLPNAKLSAIEINQKAAEILKSRGNVEVYEKSILDFSEDEKWDISLIKGVLIHIAPEELHVVYEKLYNASNRYICLVEYYNPSPVAITYRGHDGKLFKRDFAGEMLDKFSDLKLADYGFFYHRDNNFPQDDLTWFLLEKTGGK